MKEIHSFSLMDFACNHKEDERICHAALFLLIAWLLPGTLFLPNNFDSFPWITLREHQIAQGAGVRESGLLPAFTRVSYLDLKPDESFSRFCQLQCGLAPIFLLPDQWHEYLLLNAAQRPAHLPEGYLLMRDFGNGLLLLRKM